MFGGEFFDGKKTHVYNDLLFYNIPNNTWSLIKAPGAPPPRCGHQMIATSAGGGQLWVFGGEFTSVSQSQFYHYQDLWVFNLSTKKWEKIVAPNGPSARSGHRMILLKKKIFVFGGFHDNLRQFKYFNDVFVFDLENYSWNKVVASGICPSPRSGCLMMPLNDGRILIYGGYSKENIKNQLEKGHVHADAFLLQHDKNDPTGTKWKWVQTKITGANFSTRCSMSAAISTSSSTAYCFGGVIDEEDDEDNLTGHFFNDFYSLDMEKLQWKLIQLIPEKTANSKVNEEVENKISMDEPDPQENNIETEISNDGVFKVTVGPALQKSLPNIQEKKSKNFQPCPRINCGLAIKRGHLYIYGGMFEIGDKQITLNDFYSIDLKKLNAWKTIITDENSELSWVGSDSETSSADELSESEEELTE
ncbi:hypothetical protein WA026_012862 [Henosepilachna vigintioctopunctata]